jgi:hypothetical protein
VPPLEVQITVTGRVGSTLLETVEPNLDITVTPPHTVVRVGSDRMDDLVRLLRALQRLDVEVDRVTPTTCTPSG